MEKPNFEYQTLDQALEAVGGKANRRKISSTNPEGIGPETKRVMQEVYARRAEFGDDNKRVDFKWDSDNKFSAVHRAARKVGFERLRDGASLGDVYVYTAIDVAQSLAYEVLNARKKLVEAEDLDDTGGCCMKATAKYLKGDRSLLLTYWWNFEVLGKKTNEIVDAVFKDLGLTAEEAEKLHGKCEQLVAKRQEQYRTIGIRFGGNGEYLSEDLGQIGCKPGEKQGHYLRKAVEDGVDLRALRKPEEKPGLVARFCSLIRRIA